MDIEYELFLFDRVWFPKVFKIARESGLDWLRMCAAAEVLSNGDPRTREIDWEYLHSHLGPDNPIFALYYDDQERPNAELLDRASKWGLFQIHGQLAIDSGFTGRLVNLIDITKNTQIACILLARQLHILDQDERSHDLPREAEEALGWPTDQIDEKIVELKAQMTDLMTFGD